MISKYVKRPIIVEAIQYNGDNFEELANFSNNKVFVEDGWLYCMTLEGNMKAKNKAGDYLIKGIQGEFYICEKDIFEKTYMTLEEYSHVY